eukprot:2277894-Prymnesium_polylepis.1
MLHVVCRATCGCGRHPRTRASTARTTTQHSSPAGRAALHSPLSHDRSAALLRSRAPTPETALAWPQNCLLLAGYEGLPHCTAEDAETAPFGESNTFRHVARTGEPIRASSAVRLRLEVSFQTAPGGEGHGAAKEGSGGALAALLGDAYDEALPEEPFCVITLPACCPRQL